MMNFKYFFSKLNGLALLLLCSTMVYGQQSLDIVSLYSDYYLSKSARTIEAKAESFDGSDGIVFESVAFPSKNIGNSKVALDYEANRFSVTINDKKIYPELPDWQLIPTVKFVNSPYQVLFSSSGDTVGNRQAQCLYHPAFLNTLAGLRIFEADLLILPRVLWDLPKDSESGYILAQSEKPYTPKENKMTERKLYDDLSSGGRQFSSYILTDKNTNISFDIKGNKIQFTGHPYYLFVKYEKDLERIENLKKELEQTYNTIETNSKIFLGDKYTSNLNPRTNLGELLDVLKQNRSNEVFNPYPMREIIASLNKLDSLNLLSNTEIGIKSNTLSQYSTTFNRNWEVLKEYNLPVYSAVETIARWTAFFRYVKKTNPVSWNNFVRKISGALVKDAPKVDTPTTYDINYFRLIEEAQ